MPDGISMLELTTLSAMKGDARLPAERPSPDLELAWACARGEPAALESLYREHGARMKSVAFNHLGNLAEAEDAVQEAFLRVFRGARTFTGESSFSTWVYRILINTCIDVLRKRRRRIGEEPIVAVEGRREGSSIGADSALRMTLRRLLLRLPIQRRTVFLLFEAEGMSHRDIAAILGIQESYSKWLLFAAKRDLRRMLREESEVKR